jgi:hypothetical protein
MNLVEDPISPGKLVEIEQFTDGLKGQTFSLKNASGEKVVVKFQKESPAAALAGTFVLKKAGAATPTMRALRPVERTGLKTAAECMANDDVAVIQSFIKASGDTSWWPNAVVQEFSDASTLKHSLAKTRVGTFLTVICDKDFQAKLGRIIAADSFVGNPDRMFAGTPLGSAAIKGWYNEGNTLISSKSNIHTPVAIDNGFAPSYPKAMAVKAPWGLLGMITSLASPVTKYAEEEAGLLFDKFMETASKNDADSSDSIAVVKQSHRESFIKEVSRSATATMQALLVRGQQWKAQFRSHGISQETLEQFKIRKRILRLLSMGKEPNIAVTTTGNVEYKRMILEDEFKKVLTADQLVTEALEKFYKEVKQTNPGR